MSTFFDEMFQQAKKVRENAYVPYLEFKVGSCIRSTDNLMFSGCNYQNASLPLGSCSEDSAIGQMISAGCREILEVVIVADCDEITPCGGCRQQLNEFAKDDVKVHLCNLEGVVKTLTMHELLPNAFKPKTMEK